MTKKWYQSLTFWFNVVEGVLALADSFLGLGILNPTTHSIILVVGNLLLRLFKTDGKIVG
jgi:hypothetical protein